MQLSKNQKKLVHAALIGFVTGVLTAVQVAVQAGHLTEKGVLLAAAVGVVTGGVGRAAGAVLERMSTTDSPNQDGPQT